MILPVAVNMKRTQRYTSSLNQEINKGPKIVKIVLIFREVILSIIFIMLCVFQLCELPKVRILQMVQELDNLGQ